jgi:predicted O-linked N-acetylglucosamine transferase (SPINDLY family)
MCIVQRTSLSDFFSLNHILDLNLDTIHYGSGISFIQTTWCGPPYITQQSNFVRAGVVSRSYQFAGIINPPIAADKQEYIDLARSLFEDRERLDLLRQEIHSKCKNSIYNNKEYLSSCEEAFSTMLGL